MTPAQISTAIQWLIVSLFVAVLCLAQYQLATTRSQLTQALADKSTLQTDADNLAESLRKSNADKAALATCLAITASLAAKGRANRPPSSP